MDKPTPTLPKPDDADLLAALADIASLVGTVLYAVPSIALTQDDSLSIGLRLNCGFVRELEAARLRAVAAIAKAQPKVSATDNGKAGAS